MQAGLVDLLFLLYRGCAGPARAAANGDGWDEAPPSARAISHNARALAKFGRPKNACVFEGGRIWLSPHGRARLRAQLARAKPGGGPEVGRRSAYALVICRRAPCQRRLSPYESGLKLSKLF